MLVECELIEDCLANKRVGKKVQKKPFRTGQRVQGVVTNIALTPDSQVMALKTKDGFIIPEPFLNVIGEVKQKGTKQSNNGGNYEDVQEAEVVSNKREKGAVKSIYDSLKSSDIISKNSVRSKQSVNFALAGAAVGLVFAMLKQKNKMLYAAVGAVGGGLVGIYLGKKQQQNEKTNE